MTAVARTRRTSRLIGLAGACALVVVSLSGCLKLDADLTVNADATASGTLAIEFQKEAAGFLGISDLASFEENFAGEELGAEGLDQFTDCTTSETDAAYVYTCTFENETFEGTGRAMVDHEGGRPRRPAGRERGAVGRSDAALLGDANLGSITVVGHVPRSHHRGVRRGRREDLRHLGDHQRQPDGVHRRQRHRGVLGWRLLDLVPARRSCWRWPCSR